VLQLHTNENISLHYAHKDHSIKEIRHSKPYVSKPKGQTGVSDHSVILLRKYAYSYHI